MTTTELSTPITIGQVPLPMHVCYIVPADSPTELLDAVFEECYGRWGGRDTILLPYRDGAIDERYWAWVRSFDPDVVYSYVPYNEALLERIDRDLMPSAVEQHTREGTWRPHFREAPGGLHTLSLLPYLANNRRMGPPRPLGLLTKYQSVAADPFVGDSFGIAPNGPGFAGAEDVRRYTETVALGDRASDPYRSTASEDVPDTIALLKMLVSYRYEMLMMAQLSGMGYDAHRHRRQPAWDTYNIIVGDTATDRIAFWNARVGCDPYLRSQVIALRIPEARLDDQRFVDALIKFVSFTNYPRYQNSPALAVIRSASVAADRLQTLVFPLQTHNVHASVEIFTDLAECAATTESPWSKARDLDTERHTQAEVALRPLRPAHLGVWPVPRPPFTSGAWAVRTTLYREDPGARGTLKLPRRWQAVEALLTATLAKPTHTGAVRVLTSNDTTSLPLKLIADDDRFVRQLFGDYSYRTVSEPRTVLLSRLPHARVSVSNAGRQLLGFLTKIGDLQDAFALIDNPFWQAVFAELAGPLGGASDDLITEYGRRIKKRLKGFTELRSDADFGRVAEELVRLAPTVKGRRARQRFSWFLEHYRQHGEDAAYLLGLADGEQQLRDRVNEELTDLCTRAVFYQGYAWTCRHCDHANWTLADRIRPLMDCSVCRREQPLLADYEWRFLLDEAIVRGMRERGLRSVVWALGILRASAEHAFLFSPPLDLEMNGKHFTDLDIACVIDGRLVIGEAKDSNRHFTKLKSDELVKVARALRPDAIVLACPNPAAVNAVKEQVAYIKAELNDPRFDVRALTAEIIQPDTPTTLLARYFWRNQHVQVMRLVPTVVAPPTTSQP